MGTTSVSIPQSTATNALNSTVNLLGQAINKGFATDADYAQQRQFIYDANNQALAQITNTLNQGMDYSTGYFNRAMESLDTFYGKANADMAQAKAAQAGAMKAYTDQLGVTTPTQAVTPNTFTSPLQSLEV